MVEVIKLRMMNQRAEVDLSNNILTLSTVRSAFLLPADALIGLWYEINEKKKVCKWVDFLELFLK